MNNISPGKQFFERDQQLADWYASLLGKMLAEQEQEELDQVLPDLFGYHLLQIGSSETSLLSASRILHKVVLDGHQKTEAFPSQINGIPEQLPIQPDCIDAVLLHHSLDLAMDPRQVLREAERVLVPEGHLIILGFNPRSLWGLRRALSLGQKHEAPWGHGFLSVPRVKDWLALLGLEITAIHYRFFRPPIGRKAMSDKLHFLESWGQKWWPFLGGVYLLVAKKKVSTLTPIKPRWRPRRSIVQGLTDAASRTGTTLTKTTKANRMHDDT